MSGESFVESLNLTQIIDLASIFRVEHNKDSWLDDEYLEKENCLRVRLVTKIEEVCVV